MIFSRNDLGKKTAPLLRTGTVSSVNEKDATVKVHFEDRDDSTSGDLRVVSRNTMNQKHYWMPDVDEQVLCLFDPRGEEEGYVIGGLYSEQDKTPTEINSARKNYRGIWFDEKNYIYFDIKTKEFVIGHQNPIRWVDTR